MRHTRTIPALIAPIPEEFYAALADTASLSDNGLANMGSLQSVIDETKEFAEWKKWKAAQAASKPSEEFTGRLFRGRE